MSDRFYFDGSWGAQVPLSESESHHLSKVLRKTVGDEVVLFDGRGGHAVGVVSSISKREVVIDVTQPPKVVAPARPRVLMAVAPPKGDRFRWLIEKATEIGVDELIPILTERSVVNPRETKLDKLRQTMLSACKQSGRNQFMEIAQPVGLQELLAETATTIPKFYGAIPGESDGSPATEKTCNNDAVLGVIGPEGGFSDTELALLKSHNGIPKSLCRNVLRTETAAIAMATFLTSSLFGEFS